ncbi:MAG TPA: hypothetical protein VMG34_02530 [Bacteroidota bacterium]|nr:hypothetical protein [Bacteroidota bacterium]
MVSRIALGTFLLLLSVSPGNSVLAQGLAASEAKSLRVPESSPKEDSLCGGDYAVEDSSIFDLARFLPPLFRDRITLENYLRDRRFQRLRTLCGDTLAVDDIFAKAVELADGSMGYALLLAALATFDHHRVGLIVPLLGVVSIPLAIESRPDYLIRYSHLPRRVLPDSAGRFRRDRDKLQHFFGSAYLAYESDSKPFTKFVGDFVEWGEPMFIVGGDYDERDKYANRLGEEFGTRLLDGEKVLPSDVLWGR